MLIKATIANKDVKTDVGASEKEKAANWFLRSGEGEPLLFLTPELDGSSFYLKMDFYVNNEKIEQPDLYEFNGLYQKINRTFTNDKFYEDKYGKKLPRIYTTNDRWADKKANMPEAMKLACKTTTFDDYTTTQPILLRFGFDGYWPFDSQSNILAVLLNTVVPNGYFRPGSNLSMRLTKRNPIDGAVESMIITDPEYFDSAPVPALHVSPSIKIEILDLAVAYESFVPKVLGSLGKGSLRYYSDIPKLRYEVIPAKQRETNTQFQVPAGSRAFVIGFALESQLWLDASKKRNVHYRFRFIPNSTEIRCHLPDRELEFENGLQNPGVAEQTSSITCRLYHEKLRKRGLFQGSFEDLFPAGLPDKISYCQVLIADVSRCPLNEDTCLTIKITYNAKLSPADYRIFIVSLGQFTRTQTDDNKWKVEPVLYP
jgi:hypothetical protein